MLPKITLTPGQATLLDVIDRLDPETVMPDLLALVCERTGTTKSRAALEAFGKDFDFVRAKRLVEQSGVRFTVRLTQRGCDALSANRAAVQPLSQDR